MDDDVTSAAEQSNECPLPAATNEAAKDIRPINKDTVHRICSGQVVLNLGVAVKELVENSIDAGATLVEVRLRDQGLEQIEVSDNGSGVDEPNFEGLTAKYHTSKIRQFDDLAGVTTFGFRGEALSSLCALSDMLVTTRHCSATVGTRLQLDHRGAITARSTCARPVGTTVTMTQLFATLPVRKREFTKNIRKEFTRMCQLLQAYALVALGVRLICTNQPAKGAKQTVLATSGGQTTLENIVAIFGAKQRADLMELRTTDEEAESCGFRLEGWISSCAHGSGRSTRDRQYFYVNGRPCEPKLVAKVCNEVYHRYNVHQSPFVMLNVVVERRQVDVNLQPDKRQVLVNNEQALIDVLKAVLLRTFGAVPSTFKMQNLEFSVRAGDSQSDCSVFERTVAELSTTTSEDVSEADLEPKPTKFSNMLTQWRRTGRTDEPCTTPPQQRTKRKSESKEIGARNVRMKTLHEFMQQTDKPKADAVLDAYFDGAAVVKPQASEDIFDETLTPEEVDETLSKPDETRRIVCKTIDTPTTDRKLKLIPSDSPLLQQTPPAKVRRKARSVSPDSPPLRQQPQAEQSRGISPIPFVLDESSASETEESDGNQPSRSMLGSRSQPPLDLSNELTITEQQIESLMLAEAQRTADSKQRGRIRLERLRFKAAIDPNKNKVAEEELQTEIGKADFARMEIIGQFNLGFIVVRLDNDLFIVDQHASDEKYNFETLQQQTRLQNQPMVRPQPLDLTAVNEMVLMDNRQVFEMNGFKFEIDELAEPTKKCRLVAKPFSKNWEFGKEDIDELIFMLQDCPSNSVMCRPSHIRAMFASRACRKSVMVGTALTAPKMKRLVEQMGEIEHPWNCPHGRPTMRHLLNLAMLEEPDK